MTKHYILIDKWTNGWRVLDSPTPDFEVAGTTSAESIQVELPSHFDKIVSLQELINAYIRDQM